MSIVTALLRGTFFEGKHQKLVLGFQPEVIFTKIKEFQQVYIT